MNKKYILGTIIVIVVVAGGAFYLGLKFDQHQTRSKVAQFSTNGARRNLNGGMQNRGNFGAGGNVNGEIIAKDDGSITIKLLNGGSRIIFFSPSTQVNKSVQGASSDLVVGQQVGVMGQANSDGSLNAQSIQISNRPASTKQ